MHFFFLDTIEYFRIKIEYFNLQIENFIYYQMYCKLTDINIKI